MSGKFEDLNIASMLRSQASYSVHAASLPFCTFRNRESYTLSHHNAATLAASSRQQTVSLHKEAAWQQTQFCKDRLIDQSIPSYLLHNMIAEDRKLQHQAAASTANGIVSMDNSIVGCHHNNLHLFLHTAGQCFDDVVLRHNVYTRPHCARSEPGFTLPLGRGRRILELQVAALSSGNSCSHLLARTASEVFHFKTVQLDDYIPRSNPSHDDEANNTKRIPRHKRRREAFNSAVILDPINKWHVPETIHSMCSSSVANWPQTALLTTMGTLYLWTPTTGVIKYSESPVFQQKVSDSESYGITPGVHPQLYYLFENNVLRCKDLRSKSSARQIIALSNLSDAIASASIYTAGSSCSVHSPYLLLTHRGKTPTAVMLDIRFSGKQLSQRFLPDVHTTLKLKSLSDFTLPSNAHSSTQSIIFGEKAFIVGASKKCRQILIHNIDVGDMARASQSSEANLWSSLVWGSSGSHTSLSSWDMQGFNTVDRSENITLNGFDVVPCPIALKGELPFIDDDASSDKNAAPYNALLLQQSSIGDVYSQRLYFRTNMEIGGAVDTNVSSPIQIGLPCGNRAPAPGAFSWDTTGDSAAFAQTGCMRGLVLEKSIYLTDLHPSMLPASSDIFPKHGYNSELRRFDLIQMDCTNVRSDAPILPTGLIKISKPPPLINNEQSATALLDVVLPNLLEHLQDNPRTLWECWNYVAVHTEVRITIQIALRYLRAVAEITETRISCEKVTANSSFDNMRASRLPEVELSSKRTGSQCQCCVASADDFEDDAMPCDATDCLLPHCLLFKSRVQPALATSFARVQAIDEDMMTALQSTWGSKQRGI